MGSALTATRRVVLFTEDDPLVLACGRRLAPVEVAYETHGPLAQDRSNAVLVCHALTGDAHAVAPDGWWREHVGPGLAIDTERFHVVTPNLLGGCAGTTGPSSTDPRTGRPYGLDFPPLTVGDLVAVHLRLLDHLGIDRLHAAVGGSLGGMQVLELLLEHPRRLARALLVATTARLTAQNVALSAVARAAILADPAFRAGRPARDPDVGMGVARRLGHVTYLSEQGLEARFGEHRRAAAPDPDARAWLAPRHPVERYLDRQAAAFVARFDPWSYLYLSRLMDDLDPFGAGPRTVSPQVQCTVLSFSSDWRFGPDHARRLAAALRAGGGRVRREVVLDSDHGHDAFLFDVPGYARELADALAA